jgi:hypothetical protein
LGLGLLATEVPLRLIAHGPETGVFWKATATRRILYQAKNTSGYFATGERAFFSSHFEYKGGSKAEPGLRDQNA